MQGEHFKIWGWIEKVKNMRFFKIENWPYLENGKRYSQGYY